MSRVYRRQDIFAIERNCSDTDQARLDDGIMPSSGIDDCDRIENKGHVYPRCRGFMRWCVSQRRDQVLSCAHSMAQLAGISTGLSLKTNQNEPAFDCREA